MVKLTRNSRNYEFDHHEAKKMIVEELSHRIRFILKNAKMKQYTLAKEIKYSNSYITYILACKHELVSDNIARCLALSFRFSITGGIFDLGKESVIYEQSPNKIKIIPPEKLIGYKTLKQWMADYTNANRATVLPKTDLVDLATKPNNAIQAELPLKDEADPDHRYNYNKSIKTVDQKPFVQKMEEEQMKKFRDQARIFFSDVKDNGDKESNSTHDAALVVLVHEEEYLIKKLRYVRNLINALNRDRDENG